jgi:hypothetical protein
LITRRVCKMSGQVIKEGDSWVIIDFIRDETIDFAREVCIEAFDKDFSEYTSAKGKNSVQQYLICPSWMPTEDFKAPERWLELQSKFRELVQREIVYHAFMPYMWRELKPAAAWTVRGEEGSYHTAHDHGVMQISTVTYLDVPENQEYPDGQIFFVMHGNGYSPLSPPQQRLLTVKPQKGMIIMFPSWTIHGVYPQGPGIRRTLNIDFSGVYDTEYVDATPGSVTYG